MEETESNKNNKTTKSRNDKKRRIEEDQTVLKKGKVHEEIKKVKIMKIKMVIKMNDIINKVQILYYFAINITLNNLLCIFLFFSPVYLTL